MNQTIDRIVEKVRGKARDIGHTIRDVATNPKTYVVMPLIVAASYGGVANADVAMMPMASGIYTEGKPASRIELTTVGLAGNSDIYLDRETSEGYELDLMNAETLPLSAGPFSCGVKGQLKREVIDGPKKLVLDQTNVGPVVRVEGDGDWGYAKMDVHAFPNTGEVSAYGLFDSEKVFAEGLFVHNPETGNYLRINFDRKVTDHFLFGPQIESINGDATLGLRVGIQ